MNIIKYNFPKLDILKNDNEGDEKNIIKEQFVKLSKILMKHVITLVNMVVIFMIYQKQRKTGKMKFLKTIKVKIYFC